MEAEPRLNVREPDFPYRVSGGKIRRVQMMTSDESDDGVSVFESVRPRLFGIAYRMLGSAAEAEDSLVNHETQ